MTRLRWMALFFGVGSACFVVGPFPGYAQLVGETADAVTFLVGSIFFTVGGGLQTLISWPHRHAGRGGRAALWSAIVQLAGTLLFNVTTFQALHTAVNSPAYDHLVWRPDWRGSLCFLVSAVIAYLASPRAAARGWLPQRGGSGWWQPSINLLGCVFFAIAAIAGYVVPATGSVLDLAWANWNTGLGAACFLACAVDTLRSGRAPKLPIWRRLEHLEHQLTTDVRDII
jgi:hypothetical protein